MKQHLFPLNRLMQRLLPGAGNQKRKTLAAIFVLFLLSGGHTFAQTHYIQAPPVSNGTSGSNRAPNGSVDFQRTSTLYRAAEIVGLPPNAPITSVGFSINTPATAAASGTIKIYMVNTTDATYQRGTTWSSIIATPTPMTLVYNGPLTIPATAGFYDIVLQTPFAYTGGNFYFAYEWNATTKSAGSAIYNANTDLTNGLVTATGTTLPATLTGTSSFRPVLRLGFTPPPNDLNVAAVYSVGKLPRMIGVNPHVVTAMVINSGQNVQTNVPVTLAVTGANTFTTTATIASLPSADTVMVSFPGYTASNLGTNTLTVTVPTDDNPNNNTKTYSQIVTNQQLSYAQDNPPVHTTALRPLTPNGTLLAKFHVNNSQSITINQVNMMISFFADNVGKTVYAVIQDAAGVQIARSPDYVIQTADLSTMKTFTITTPPTLTNTDYYVGMAAVPNAVVYYPLGVQAESPARPNTFYTGPIAGGTPVLLGSDYRLIIEPVLTSVGADAGVTAVTTPTATACSSASSQICVTLMNTGTTSLTNIPVSYAVTGAGTATASEVYAGPLAPGATFNYCFTATANLSATGAYTISATAGLTGDVNATNNATTASTTIAPLPATPTVTAGGTTTFCSGGSVTLTAASTTTGATYQWYNNGTLITGATSATYTANAAGVYTAVALQNGCSSAASTATTVTVNTAPATPTVTAGGTTTLCTGGSVVLTGATTTTGATYQWMNNGTAITGATSATYTATTPGSYTVMATANGCSATSAATTVTVNAPAATPTITAAGSTTICAGTTVDLTAASTTTGATYQWSLNGTTIPGATSATFTANTAGSYTVVATANGCPSAASTATTVTVNPKPATPTITNTNNVLSTPAVTGATYQWYSVSGTTLTPVSGATVATFMPTVTGSYTVRTTVNGCESDAATATTVVVGIGKLAPGMDVSVFPNPSKGEFQVKLVGFEKEVTMQLVSITGQVIAETSVAAGKTNQVFTLNGLAKGVYILKVTSAENLTFRKVIVE